MTTALNRLFAQHVAGITDISMDELEDVDMDARSVCTWTELRGTKNGERVHVPDFCASSDAVLPFLDACDDWDARRRNGSRYRVTIYQPSEEFEGEAASFPTAAVRALLKAHGIATESP